MIAIRALVITALLLVAACASPAMDPDLSLHDRFVLTALTDDAGSPINLYRWSWPLRIEYHGPARYRDEVERHAEALGVLASQPVRIVQANGNVIVKIDSRRKLRADAMSFQPRFSGMPGQFSCFYTTFSDRGRYTVLIGISDDLSPERIRRCIVQEMTQPLGLWGDIDGRTDTVFTSDGHVGTLTVYDQFLLQILYDDRLYHGMSRDQVLAVLPAIVADVEAQQEAGR